MDATCAPADVAYPIDLNLLNAAREKLEAIIDTLHEPIIGKTAKPCTHREKAHKQLLAVSKQRKPGVKVIRKAVRHQLGYVGGNLAIIAEQIKMQPLTRLGRKAYRDPLVIHELYRQQLQMYKALSHQVEDRIVIIHQPAACSADRARESKSASRVWSQDRGEHGKGLCVPGSSVLGQLLREHNAH